MLQNKHNNVIQTDSSLDMKIEHSEEPVVEFWQLLPESFKAEENWKPCAQTEFKHAQKVLFKLRSRTENLCASIITSGICVPIQKTKYLHLQTSMCKFPAVISSSFTSVTVVSTPQCREMSCCLCALELWDNIRFTQVLLELSSAGPAPPQSFCVCATVYSLSSLGATWSARRFWLGPVETWGPGTESSRRSWSKVPRLGKRKSVWRTGCL